MFRCLLQLICSAWIAAALMVSPALAALDCACCQPMATALQDVGGCEHRQPSQRSTCCESPAGPKSEPCRECPTCQFRQSSVPATLGTERVVRADAPLLVAARIELPVQPAIRDASSTRVSDTDHSPPPSLMVLNCRWQK